MMKILIVSNMYPNINNKSYGIFVQRFCKQLDYLNIDYTLSVMNQGNKIKQYCMFYLKSFFTSLKKWDYIYIHYPSFSALPVILASLFKKNRIITNVHGSDVIPENIHQKMMLVFTKIALNLSEKIVVPSQYFKKIIQKQFNINKPIYVYPSGGINTNVFFERDKSSVDSCKEKYNIPKSNLVIGYAGRISKDKGWDTYVKAIYLMKKNTRTNATFLLIGSGPEENKLKDLINKYKLADVILRLPMQSEEQLADLYSCMDYFVFPTKRLGESLGLVALEAMACGVPVIASDYAAPHYYINNHNGRKFEVDNAEDLYKQIIDILNSNRNNLKIGALETANRYSDNTVISILKRTLDE